MARTTLESYMQGLKFQITFGEYLPFAGLATRTVGEDVVEIIKQGLHLTSPLPLRHLVADAKLRSPAVASTSGGEWVRRVNVL
jgi:hypothetical protein